MIHTFVESHSSLSLKQDVDFRLFAPELVAYFVHILQKTDIGFDELEFASSVELRALLYNAVGRLLGPANKVHSWTDSILGE